MFKKPLSNIKTSAPLRSSDRRKLKQRVITAFGITSEEGDLLVPDGILSVKFITHLEGPGVAYIDPEGDPLWFTIGKGSEDLIPTIYTLWKKQDLLPFLSTPSAVIPVLIGGADLMIPGVIHCPPDLREQQLVTIRQYTRKDNQPGLSPPLAIGRMALDSSRLRSSDTEKGKAVHIIHIWKDYLWDMGSKKEMPKGMKITTTPAAEEEESESESETDEPQAGDDATPPPPTPAPDETSDTGSAVKYTPTEVTELLNLSLIQAISTTLKSLPISSFPISATQLYQNYLLPSRPAFPTVVLSPSTSTLDMSSKEVLHVDTEITIKTSTHKSLTTFLKAAEKQSLLTLKPPQKQQPDILVTSVNGSHPSVANHTSFPTVKDLELRAAKKKAATDEKEQSQVGKEIEVKELWKPHQTTVELFKKFGASESELYTGVQIRSVINSYITTHGLVNPRDQAYINLDDTLYSCVSESKGKKNKESEPEPPMSRFMKRDELTKKIVKKMQCWYEIQEPGKDPIKKKGILEPIQVAMKVRQGRKVATMVSGFEPFLVVDAEEMAEDLRKLCAGATSVSPITGKPASAGKLEVLVQGKHSGIVVEYLLAKGIPKKWVEVADLSKAKQGK